MFGIGTAEIFFLIIMLLLLFKPEDLVSVGKSIGKFYNSFKKSGLWKSFRNLRQSVKNVGQDFINESGIEELQREFDVTLDIETIRKELNQ